MNGKLERLRKQDEQLSATFKNVKETSGINDKNN
jgi:hypothetical protein